MEFSWTTFVILSMERVPRWDSTGLVVSASSKRLGLVWITSTKKHVRFGKLGKSLKSMVLSKTFRARCVRQSRRCEFQQLFTACREECVSTKFNKNGKHGSQTVGSIRSIR